MFQTFRLRHLGISNGTKPSPHVTDAPEWSKPKPKPKSRSKHPTTTNSPRTPGAVAAADAGADSPSLMWDFNLMKFVPCTHGSSVRSKKSNRSPRGIKSRRRVIELDSSSDSGSSSTSRKSRRRTHPRHKTQVGVARKKIRSADIPEQGTPSPTRRSPRKHKSQQKK